jgi:uncharacterized membrane protein
MGNSWVSLLIILILAVGVLAIIGLVALVRMIAGPSPQNKTSDNNLEDLKRTLRQHEERLNRLEGKADSPKVVQPRAANSQAVVQAPKPATPPLPRKASSDSMEAAVAGRWFQWIALAALLFGLGYFLKLAFENNWIGPMGRVALGWFTGALFLVMGHRWFTRYPGWAQSLAGGGLAFLYLSSYAAFQFYHLLDSGTAFALMILTTAVGSAMAMADKSLSLAIFTSLGGFLTPALVSTGEDHQVILMSYLLVLNVGIFFLSVYGGWRHLRWGAAFFTVVYCSEYASRFYNTEKLWTTLGFHTAFYLLFAGAIWFQDFKKRKDADTADALFAVLNGGVYYATCYALLTNPAYHNEYDLLTALLAIGLAGLYTWQSMRLLRSKNPSAAYLSTIFLGLGGAFFAVAIPAYLNKSWITVGWALEAVFLVWAGLREKRPFTRILGFIVLGLAAARLVIWDWEGVTQTLFFNDRLIPYGTVLAAVTTIILLLSNRKPRPEESETIIPILAIAGNLIALFYLSLEVADFWNRQMPPAPWNAKALSLSVLWLLYAAGMMAAGFVKDIKGLRLVAIMTFWVTIVKVFFYDLSELQGGYRVLSLMFLGMILLGVSYAYQRKGKKPFSKEG